MEQREEITDMINESAYEDPNFKKGLALKFQDATLIVTKVDRKNKRAWARHAVLVTKDVAMSHYGHLIDITDETQKQYGGPWCDDCQTLVGEGSTEDGEVKAKDRQDRQLEDGTLIDEYEEIER